MARDTLLSPEMFENFPCRRLFALSEKYKGFKVRASLTLKAGGLLSEHDRSVFRNLIPQRR